MVVRVFIRLLVRGSDAIHNVQDERRRPGFAGEVGPEEAEHQEGVH